MTNGSLEEWLLESSGGQSPASAVGSRMGQWAHGMRAVASDGQPKLGARFHLPVVIERSLLLSASASHGAGLWMPLFPPPGENVRNPRRSRPSFLPEALRGSSPCLW